MKGVIEKVGTVVSIIVGGMTIVGWMNSALLDHLDKSFATKQDLQRIEQKIDSIATGMTHGKRAY